MAQEKLDRQSIRDACYRIARTTMWATHPVDSAKIQAVGDSLYGTALFHEEYVLESGRDPNILLRCVEYLESTHAIPAMLDDTKWFRNMLEVLIELAIPNSVVDPQNDEFFRDIETGLSVSRSGFVDSDEKQS